MLKKVLAVLVCSTMAAAGLTSCGKEIKVEESGSEASKGSATTHTIDISRFSDRTAPQFDAASSDIKNFSPLEKGEQIVVMTIKGYGDVKIRLFPEYASKGVENFVELAKQGYYDGLTFHRVISDFMIQGGDPEGTGGGGQSIWGEKFDGGTDSHLIHAAGAVAYANSGSTATNGSQFYIVTGTAYGADDLDQMGAYYGKEFSEDAKAIYTSVGGTPWLDGGYTVFGQVFEGLDIIFGVQDVDTTTSTNSPDAMVSPDKPIEDLIIETIKVAEYNGEELRWYISDYK